MLPATQNPTPAPILTGSGQHCHIGLPLPLPPKARWRWTCPMYRAAYQECLVPQVTLARRENPSLCPLSLSCYCENRNLGFLSTHDLAPPPNTALFPSLLWPWLATALLPPWPGGSQASYLVPRGHRSPCHVSSPALLLRDSTPAWLTGGWSLISIFAKAGSLIISPSALILLAKVPVILQTVAHIAPIFI